MIAMIKTIINIGFQIKEGLKFTIDSLRLNKLRTFLSLFGITIGIFAIISIFTVLDTLQSYIQNNMNSLGGNTVYVKQFPWGPEEGDTEYKWWKYMNRPAPTIKDYKFLNENLTLSDSVAFAIYLSSNVQYGREYINRCNVVGATYGYASMRNTELSDGRFLTNMEIESGQNICLIGADIASELFGNSSPINKAIKVKGHKLKVAGVIKREGGNMFGNSADKWVYVSHKFVATLCD
ncbi:MAG: ABC transporter permease, partial [Rikenellaceae bacterium]